MLDLMSLGPYCFLLGFDPWSCPEKFLYYIYSFVFVIVQMFIFLLPLGDFVIIILLFILMGHEFPMFQIRIHSF